VISRRICKVMFASKVKRSVSADRETDDESLEAVEDSNFSNTPPTSDVATRHDLHHHCINISDIIPSYNLCFKNMSTFPLINFFYNTRLRLPWLSAYRTID
jgi:hypothetical protein